MILIRLKGGLGNQLFQYAAGRALALRQKKINTSGEPQIKLDVTGYGVRSGLDTVRHYTLDIFNIRSEIATSEEIRKLKYPHGIISKGWRFFKAKILRQFNTGFVENIFNTQGSIYLDGFFQTEKYFIDHEKEIRDDLTLKVPLSNEFRKILDIINTTPYTVSLHVRRGDYVQDQNTNKYHGTCDKEYYKKALEILTEKIGKNLHIFIFSDDIDWVKENMLINYPVTYVSSPNIKDYEELILMSACKHNIISNSSFSWWGAWLNKNPDKIVIAPKRWVMKDEKRFKDICPNSWIRI